MNNFGVEPGATPNLSDSPSAHLIYKGRLESGGHWLCNFEIASSASVILENLTKALP